MGPSTDAYSCPGPQLHMSSACLSHCLGIASPPFLSLLSLTVTLSLSLSLSLFLVTGLRPAGHF